jgi:hypothetical protein
MGRGIRAFCKASDYKQLLIKVFLMWITLLIVDKNLKHVDFVDKLFRFFTRLYQN